MSVFGNVKFILVYIIILFSRCSVDTFSPCEDNLEYQNLLCKEYRFNENTAVGSIQYLYNENFLNVRKDFLGLNGELKKSIVLSYEDGNLKKETEYDANGNHLRETSYDYDTQNNISNINNQENGVIVYEKTFEYQDTFLLKESEFNNGSLDNYITYQYFSDDDLLFKKAHFNSSGSLNFYTTHEYFINGVERHNHYLPNHTFIGFDVYNFNGNKQIIRETSYDSDAEILEYTTYDYSDSGKIIKSAKYDQEDQQIAHTVYIYY